MLRSFPGIIVVILYIVCSSCHSNPKPASGDVTKTAVTVNGHKDSVSNNPQKNYGNATVAEPCVKCLIQAVQNTAEYKAAVVTKSVNDINYVVNWAEGANTGDTTNKRSVTNALKLDVTEKKGSENKIVSFIYDNSLSKLFFASKNGNTEIKIDSAGIKKIRMKCYWGVASSK